MKQKIEITGALVFDVNKKKFTFNEGWGEYMFTEGVFRSEYSHCILVRFEALQFDIPADFDTIKPQLDALDSKEKELTFQYKQALNHITTQRNNLLALEN